jgi:glycosyltransferase involved in cell wall biosynthesis
VRQLTSFPTGDAGALRERLRALLALPAGERKALGLAARSAVERNWSWTRVAERLLEPLAAG